MHFVLRHCSRVILMQSPRADRLMYLSPCRRRFMADPCIPVFKTSKERRKPAHNRVRLRRFTPEAERKTGVVS